MLQNSVSNNGLTVGILLVGSLFTGRAEAKPIVSEHVPPSATVACSFRRPICVHDAEDTRALDALERAWEAGIVLGVPLPRSYDAWVRSEPSRSAISERDLIGGHDRATAFSVLDARKTGCARDFDAARELYAASALGATPAIDDATLRAETTALARLAFPCGIVDTGVFQAHPDRALADGHVAPGFDEGAALFFSWIDGEVAKEPGHFITSTWAFAETKTPPAAGEWAHEPDVYDVVRESMKDVLRPGGAFEDALVELAIMRALDAESAPPLDWDVTWPAAARTLASPQGIAETGAAYVRITTQGHKPGAHFRVDARWEEHAKMRWVVVKLDAGGREIGRQEATAPPKAVEAHLQVWGVEDAASLLVVATNTGNWTTPFDPDDDVWEPHGWLLTIAAE
jgi:hypothetical protein